MKQQIIRGTVTAAFGLFVCFLLAAFAIDSPSRLAKNFLGQEQPSFVVRVAADHGQTADRGSGTLIRADLVLTAHHVVRDARPGSRVFVQFKDGLERDAKIIKWDKTLDLALLSIEPVILPAARPATKEVVKNQQVTICGFPLNGDYKEVKGRVVGFRGTKKKDKLYFTVSNRASSGMSGGPVLNVSGDVVGVLFGSLRYANCTSLNSIKEFLDDIE